MEETVNKPIQKFESDKKKPPYLMGLLGFIPLVGFFVGVVLIILGITQYKDKKLTLIGLGGILFTVIVYSSIYYIGVVSDLGKDSWGQVSQIHLNRLIKNVEYYKIENGKYPDSLQQLESENEVVFIQDLTQGVNEKQQKYFNYENLGDKFLLFSSGNDRKPNTNDDIYPKLKKNTKTGWVKNK